MAADNIRGRKNIDAIAIRDLNRGACVTPERIFEKNRLTIGFIIARLDPCFNDAFIIPPKKDQMLHIIALYNH